MIVELRTFELQPGRLPEAERRLADASRRRQELSPLGASLRTEIGPLNRLVQLWPFADRAALRAASAAARRLEGWPPALGDALRRQRVERLEPFDFSPPLPAGALGPYFELRTYECASADDLERLAAVWRLALPARLEHGPLAGVWRAGRGARLRFVHLWPYRSLDGRAELRRRVRELGVWPPPLVARRRGLPAWRLTRQETQILVASEFSPLR